MRYKNPPRWLGHTWPVAHLMASALPAPQQANRDPPRLPRLIPVPTNSDTTIRTAIGGPLTFARRSAVPAGAALAGAATTGLVAGPALADTHGGHAQAAVLPL